MLRVAPPPNVVRFPPVVPAGDPRAAPDTRGHLRGPAGRRTGQTLRRAEVSVCMQKPSSGEERERR